MTIEGFFRDHPEYRGLYLLEVYPDGQYFLTSVDENRFTGLRQYLEQSKETLRRAEETPKEE